MLSPKKVKHRKQHRGRMRGLSKGGTKVNFGDFGLQAIEPGWITSRQIESARVAITRHVKRGGKVWIYKGDVVPVREATARRRAAEQDAATSGQAPAPAGTDRPPRSSGRGGQGGPRSGGGGGGQGRPPRREPRPAPAAQPAPAPVPAPATPAKPPPAAPQSQQGQEGSTGA